MFSGCFRTPYCKVCKREVGKGRAYPTSLMLIIFLGINGAVLLSPITERLWLRIIIWIASFIVAAFAITLPAYFFDIIFPEPKKCPQCGNSLEFSGGFYDFSFIPTWGEILGFIVYFSLIITLRIAVAGAPVEPAPKPLNVLYHSQHFQDQHTEPTAGFAPA